MLDIVENGRRTPLSSDTDMWFPQFVLPNNLLFIRRLTNPGVWTAPFENGALDLTRAAMVQPGATDFDAARDGTLLVRFTARNRRNLVWVTRSGQTTPVPGPALEMTNASFELAPEGGRVLMSIRGPRLQGRHRGPRSRHGHGYPGAAASAGGRDDAGGHCLLGAWRTAVLRCGRRRNVRDLRLARRRIDWWPQARGGHERANDGGR